MTSILIAFFLQMIVAISVLNHAVQEQQRLQVEVKEYRKYNQYDYTHVYQPDIVQLIFKERGSTEIIVKADGTTVRWGTRGQSNSSEYTAKDISNAIPIDKKYDSAIKIGSNGGIVGYLFIEHVDDGSCLRRED